MKKEFKSYRKYISIYFQDGLYKNRKKRDVTISFSSEDLLYEKCKDLGSSIIKEIIGIHSYKELLQKAGKESRTINNYNKYRLRKKLNLI